MSSQVYFRLQYGKVLEPIEFTGPHIKLIDLKRAILEKKNMKTGFDFDLKICDAENNSKVFEGDQTDVPKNTSVVVRRMPVPVGTGILSRLKAHGHSSGVGSNEILLPTKAEESIDEVSEVKTEGPQASAEGATTESAETTESGRSVEEMIAEQQEDEEEMALLRSITERYNLKLPAVTVHMPFKLSFVFCLLQRRRCPHEALRMP